jgi:hypothetical protein
MTPGELVMYSRLRSGEKLKDELVFAMLDRTRARQRLQEHQPL